MNSEQVEYLLVGGYAVGYHGYPRATADIDFWVARNSENAPKLARVLQKFGFSAASAPPTLFLTPKKIIRMGIPPLRIEVLTDVSALDFTACYSHRVHAVIDGVEVSLIALDDLKRNKLASGRPKDLDDVQKLP